MYQLKVFEHVRDLSYRYFSRPDDALHVTSPIWLPRCKECLRTYWHPFLIHADNQVVLPLRTLDLEKKGYTESTSCKNCSTLASGSNTSMGIHMRFQGIFFSAWADIFIFNFVDLGRQESSDLVRCNVVKANVRC